MGGGLLCAVLATPPLTSGARSRNMVGRAASVLGFDDHRIVNLCLVPTPHLPALDDVGAEEEGWSAARKDLAAGLADADGLLAAWGTQPLTGLARGHRAQQLRWVADTAALHGHRDAWTVSRQPRHPSRWHQHVSDRHGRTSGGPLADRLREVLVAVPLRGLC